MNAVRLWNEEKKTMREVVPIKVGGEIPLFNIERFDKEGTPIFEGDVLEDIRGRRAVVCAADDESNRIVGGYVLRVIPESTSYAVPLGRISWLETARVIGNKYENKNLLTGE